MASKYDILGQMDESNSTNSSQKTADTSASNSKQDHFDDELIKYLKSIDESIEQLVKQSNSTSQSSARDRYTSADRLYYGYTQAKFGKRDKNLFRSQIDVSNVVDDFTDALEKELLDALGASDLRNTVAGALGGMAAMLGVQLRDLPAELGSLLGKHAIAAFKQTNIGKVFSATVSNIKDQAVDGLKSKIADRVNKYDESHGGTGYYNRAFAAGAERYEKQRAQREAERKSKFGNMGSQQAASYDSGNTQSEYKDINLSEIAWTIDTANVLAKEMNVIVQGAYNVQQAPQTFDTSGIDVTEMSTDFPALASPDVSEVTELLPQFAESLSTATSEVPEMGKALATATPELTGMMSSLGGSMSSMALTMPELAVAIGIAILAFKAVERILKSFGPAIEGAKGLFEAAKSAGNRYYASREKRVKLAQERLEADVESMIKAPFDILENAAKELYDVWDSNLRMINATQGYDKSQLQDLLSAYSERLRTDNLTNVVPSSDITSNLAKVIESGLTGKIAEEFAYQATVLNAAIPNQDFFSLGESYGSIVANAMSAGKSQAEALTYANDQLSAFANNLLYTSRQLTGGVSTGLKDINQLFASSVEIANASKIGQTSEISGVMTAVSGVVGSIAPDLATSLTDILTKAAVGGNSSEIVALRSLANVNASNSEFLSQLAKDPQKIFSTMFANLAQIQQVSSATNRMEVAEGLADVFGIPMEAFQRIDFEYLSNAISEMNLSSSALSENMNQLVSGETTLTADQLKYQQINQYALDKGLALVLDNNVARSIQEHMWNEQMKLEMIEATYGVELKGKALEFLEGIRQTVDNLLAIFSPSRWFRKLADLAGTVVESYAQAGDIKQVLRLGQVGEGNSKSMYQLTTRGKDLNVTKNIVDLLGGRSYYAGASGFRNMISSAIDLGNTGIDLASSASSKISAALSSRIGSELSTSRVGSSYTWRTVGKSISDAMRLTYGSPHSSSSAAVANTSLSSVSDLGPDNKSLIDQMVSNIDQYKTYSDFEKGAKNLGISNLQSALEDSGRSLNQIQDYYKTKNAEDAYAENQQRYADEKDFRDKGRAEWIDVKKFRDEELKPLHTAQYTAWEEEKTFRDTTLTSRWAVEDNHFETISSKLSDIYTTIGKDKNSGWRGQWTSWRSDDWTKWYSGKGGWSTYESAWESWKKAWEKYYAIDQDKYASTVNWNYVSKVQKKEKDDKSNVIYKIADQLVQNNKDQDALKSPAIQTNTLLAQILIVVNAIMNQNNKSNTGSLAETLSELALGL